MLSNLQWPSDPIRLSCRPTSILAVFQPNRASSSPARTITPHRTFVPLFLTFQERGEGTQAVFAVLAFGKLREGDDRVVQEQADVALVRGLRVRARARCILAAGMLQRTRRSGSGRRVQSGGAIDLFEHEPGCKGRDVGQVEGPSGIGRVGR